MLTHGEIWQAIDRLAAFHGLSASALARRAGLDPTTFNRSKRMTRDGKPRWPSTESIAKILNATGTPMSSFISLLEPSPGGRIKERIPVIGYAQAGAEGYFDDAGYPVGTGWDEVLFPDIGDPHAFALEISGDSMEPVYRDGDIIIISPESDIRRNDRVVLRTTGSEVMAKQLLRQSANRVDLRSLNPDIPDRTITRTDIAWISRIMWVSQ